MPMEGFLLHRATLGDPSTAQAGPPHGLGYLIQLAAPALRQTG
jgi:hypothetical protein